QSGDPVTVATEHPRLMLRPARLRLLRRERERKSPRWMQFEAFISGKAPMPEPGFAQALYYQISGDAEVGKQAVQWALGPASDWGQRPMVCDWCQDVLSEPRRRALAARLEKGIAAAPADDTVATARSRTLAAVALFDHVPQTPQRELERVVHTWWE